MNIDVLRTSILLLWPAVCQVESNFNPNAIGDGGRAVGIAQIHKIVIDDVNRIYDLKPHFTYEDRFDPEKSKAIFHLYLAHWGKVRNIDDVESLARLWNAGPRFATRMHATDNYWKKVQVELNRIELAQR